MRAKLIYALLIATLLISASFAGAQAIPANTQFDVTGFIQAATLDPTCAPGDVLCGGTITVNHQLIVVPKNTILQMPAAALTWQQVFANAPAPYTGSQTGMAISDVPRPYANYEAHVVGNRNGNTYIAGLIFLAQHSLQSDQGFINFIDYSTGEFYVGGTMGSKTGTRVMINDPAAKFGRGGSPDTRFTIDENNPTVRSETGYPMCIPRAAPPAPPVPPAPPAIVETDGLCPSVNRPLDITSPSGFAMILTMATPAAVDNPANANSNLPDPRLMAPFEVGDYVTYSGILLPDKSAGAPTPTYIAAYQVIGNVGLFTASGVDPAYVATDVMLLGVGGTTVAGLAEATIRTRFEGFTTDPSRNIILNGVDVDSCTGTNPAALRNWGVMGVDPGLPKGAVFGRWRFRPPCKGLTLADVSDKVCLGPAAGSFLPATREMRSTIEGVAGSGIPAAAYVTKNGLNANMYQAPIFEFLFPENVAVGSPVVPNNFEDMPFLANGSGPVDPSKAVTAIGGSNPIVGQLNPWPMGFVAPAAPPVCANAPKLPLANAGPDQTVQSSALVTLTAAASTDPNVPPQALTFAWAQTAGSPVVLTPTDPTNTSVTFTAPSISAALSFKVTVTNTVGPSTATVNVTVNGAAVPTVTATSNLTQIASGGTVALTATAAGTGPFTYLWSQTAGPAGTFTPAIPNAASVTWAAPAVAVATPATFQVIATNATGPSTPASVTITIAKAGAPVIGAIAAQSVPAGSAVTIPVSATSTNLKANLSLAVAANTVAAKVNNVSKSCTATLCTATWTVTFTAPATAQTINLSLTATDASVTPNLSSVPATATITVTTVGAPTNVSAGANQTVPSATPVVTLSGSATGATSFAWTQIGGTPVGLSNANTATATFRAPTVNVLPAAVLTFRLTATNAGGSRSATVTVTVTPPVDTITISTVEYRIAKQRLLVDATSSAHLLNPSAQLTMQAYDASNNKLGRAQSMPFNATLNLYEVIIVGALRPDHVIVTSTYGGSQSSPITILRTN